MIVAITSTGNSLESFIDPRFGRCSYFIFYNTETKESVFQPNPFKDNDEGVGVDVVEWIATFSCSKIVSGQFGMKIKPLLDESRIQLILVNDPKLTIRQIINLLDH